VARLAWPLAALLAGWVLCVAAPAARAADGASGAVVFGENCAGCHGSEGLGGFGPTLEPAGTASLVASMVARGGIDMPVFKPGLDEAQIDAVAAFVARELSAPAARAARVPEGGELYRLYCAGCHGSTGRGGALTVGRNPPDVSLYPAAMALAAMMLGRAEMPVFAGNTLDVRQQTSVARYVEVLVEPPSPGGHGLGYLGPVPEGAVAGAGLLVLVALAVWLAWKARRVTA
jgi:ubiquinol-cytochrome c reductase cytochrome c subunit